MAEIFEGFPHRVILEGGGKPIQINLHHTGDVAGHAEIVTKLGEIMSAVSDYIAKQKEFNASIKADVAGLGTVLTSIDGDITALNDKIAALTVSPDDQAALEELKGDGADISSKLKALADSAKAIDARTPPVAPPTP